MRRIACSLVLFFLTTGGLRADLFQGATVISNSTVLCGGPGNIFGENTALCASDFGFTLVFQDSTAGTVDSVFFKTASPITLNDAQLFANGDFNGKVQNGGLPREFAEFRLDLVDSSNSFVQSLVDITPSHPESSSITHFVDSFPFADVSGQYFRAEWVQGDYKLTGPRIDSLQGFEVPEPAIGAPVRTGGAGCYGIVTQETAQSSRGKGRFGLSRRDQPREP